MAMRAKDVSEPAAAAAARSRWAHTPTLTTRLWLFISLPLIAWDAGYVFFRPHSMPGGALHSPLWVPYGLYGELDYVYGWKAFHDHNGFVAAQSVLNVVEAALYLYYLFIVFTRGAPRVTGPMAGVAVLTGFSAAVMTLSKTTLYFLNEYFSGFENIGHNPIQDLLLLWVVPNGFWIVLPSYMAYSFGCEMLEGLAVAAAGGTLPPSGDKSTVKTE